MKKVTLTFIGDDSDLIAKKFYHWIIDGGLEDSIIQTLSTDKTSVEGIIDFNNDDFEIAIASKNKVKLEKNIINQIK